jgi:hypothetical protein
MTWGEKSHQAGCMRFCDLNRWFSTLGKWQLTKQKRQHSTTQKQLKNDTDYGDLNVVFVINLLRTTDLRKRNNTGIVPT